MEVSSWQAVGACCEGVVQGFYRSGSKKGYLIRKNGFWKVDFQFDPELGIPEAASMLVLGDISANRRKIRILFDQNQYLYFTKVY